MDKYWKISDFAKEVGRHINTIDGWFKELEEKQIHFVNREENRKEKVYDQLDLNIALFIKEKRQKKWAIDIIFNELPKHHELRSPIKSIDVETTNNLQNLDIEQIKNNLKAEILEEMKGQFGELHKKLDEQQKYIEQKLETRDQLLMEALKESLEVKKQIAASTENKNKWWEFWK